MTPVRFGLVALPLVTFALTVYAVRPVTPARAPRRLAVARASVLVGTFGVLTVEGLSAVGRLTTGGVVAVWVAAVAAAGVGAWFRKGRGDGHSPSPRTGGARDVVARWVADLRDRLRGLPGFERVVLAAIVVLVAAELVLALFSPPNTYDSQTYHLPRIEQWAQRGSVDLFPTGVRRQITYPPGAEFLLLHLRLLTGVDTLYNLLQWSAGVLCLLLVTRLAAQLGVGRRGQLLAALVAGSVPMMVLQASSTQTDLAVAAWVACVATLALDGVGRVPLRRPDLATVLLLGAATGLVTLTKATGGLLAGPFLVWWTLAQARRVWWPPEATQLSEEALPAGEAGAGGRSVRRRTAGLARVALAAVGIIAVAGVISGPQFARMIETFGHPLGPPNMRETLTMQRHDPASLLINGLRQAHTALEIPVPPVNRWVAARIVDLAEALGRDPNDPKTTFFEQTFPDESWYPSEDKAALPLHALLIGVGVALAAVRGWRPGGDRRLLVYSAAIAVAALGYAVAFKWQPWGNRLLLFIVVVGAPLAGAWLGSVFERQAALTRSPKRSLRPAVAALLVVATCAGMLSAVYGHPRRLVGGGSVFVRDDLSARFAMRPEWLASYRKAAADVNARNPRRVGLVSTVDGWEYPFYYMLDAPVLRSMQSSEPSKLKPATWEDVDAMVCAGPTWFCYQYIHASWTFWSDETVSYGLPPKT
ncbi:hypothetical protein [Virgisporangium ochraceum]|uniref:Glycosyltransferase RgtA/B/C/D-like domain-containing protein n=1 Tax=Virgisporangium ochraceum TaxID=65505 RepID=A0A8J4EAV4_9ACTN|nr:hypothetical protein [Virgisporangium ochraceum]GIJ65157.1 hypothetical protein Voc01_000740 [Virgisporangium ochraceum]